MEIGATESGGRVEGFAAFDGERALEMRVGKRKGREWKRVRMNELTHRHRKTIKATHEEAAGVDTSGGTLGGSEAG